MNKNLETNQLGPALQTFAKRLAQSAPFQVHLDADLLPQLSDKTRATILSVIEEAAANAQAHAQADHLWLTLRCDPDALHISVRDDGRGFDLEAVQREREAQGIDLASDLRARVAAVGGELTLQSVIGKGTTLRVVVPLAH
jgi:signal transduction histidine kinase